MTSDNSMSIMKYLAFWRDGRWTPAGFGPLATKLLALLRPDAARERLAASSQGRRRSDVGELDFQLGEGTGCAEAKASLHSGISTHSRRSHRKLKADGAAVLCLDGVAQ